MMCAKEGCKKDCGWYDPMFGNYEDKPFMCLPHEQERMANVQGTRP